MVKVKDKDKIYLEILKEHMLYQRHQETQRMWTANIFIAIVVGTLVYSTGTDMEQFPWLIPFAFLIISTICLLITLKLNAVFARTQDAMENAFKDISHFTWNQEESWERYMRGRKSKKGIWKILRIRYLYLALYALAIIGASVWLFILNERVARITVPIVAVIVIIAIIFAIIEHYKEKKEQKEEEQKER